VIPQLILSDLSIEALNKLTYPLAAPDGDVNNGVIIPANQFPARGSATLIYTDALGGHV
jgi:hypothetical protein